MTLTQIQERITVIATELSAISETIELLKNVSFHESPHTLTVEAFRDAMVQQAKDFGKAVSDLQERVKLLEGK